uniref:Uncharacterized protein n=1 Tax=uncultured Desulfobacterium sp. TaxID=201089 RepID=E1YMM4_9BACT|nr:unknown protein [uncultured Desulfobacterium sp.]
MNIFVIFFRYFYFDKKSLKDVQFCSGSNKVINQLNNRFSNREKRALCKDPDNYA